MVRKIQGGAAIPVVLVDPDTRQILGGAGNPVVLVGPDGSFAVPVADSTVNELWGDVIGNKLDTIAGNSLMSLLKVINSEYITIGTARAGNTSTRIQLATSASATDGDYDPALVYIISGTGAGQCRRIYEYDGTNRYAYVNRDWKVTPDTTSVYCVMIDPGNTHVNEGVAQGGGVNTITLNALASAQNNLYLGQMIFIVAGTGADQARMVISYNGATKIATVDSNWVVQPDATSVYCTQPFPGFIHGRPAVDSASNTLMRDVIGNKDDTTAGTSIVSLLKGVAASKYDTCLFTGTVRYVSQSGDDGNGGLAPDDAFATIGKAITESGAGDAIRVGYGTYDEDGLDLNLNSLELWLEAGVIIQNSANNTVLTLSGFGCVVRGSGNVRLDPTGGATGILVSGNFCYLNNLRVNCNSVGALGYDFTGDGIEAHDCRCSDPITAAFKVQGDGVVLYNGDTSGNTTSIGYWITNSCERARLFHCSSQGHETAPFQVDTGCTDGVVWEFSSGGGDGKWADVDNATVISDLTYPETKFAYSTFTAAGGVGGTGTNYNIFKITGTVKVFNIFGHVTTATPATNSTVNLELYSTNAAVDITDAAGAPDLVSRVVGTTLAREGSASEPLELSEPDNTPAVIENASFNNPSVPIILIEDDAADTYIQVVLTAALASGAIHWHVEWEPVTDDGFVEAL